MIKDNDYVYAAGFIDGEGSFDISILRPTPNNRRKYTFYVYRLIVVNTNMKVLNFLKDCFGGSITKRKKYENRKECYHWALHGDNLVSFCHGIYPYSIVKKQQIEVIFEYSKTIDGRRNTVTDKQRILREELWKKMKALNKIG